MSEVKSARELAEEIVFKSEWLTRCELIHSDRRAIIEKCKEAVDNVYAFGEDGRQCKHEALDALDSVLSEIEKEE